MKSENKQQALSRAFSVFLQARNAGVSIVAALVIAAGVGAYSYTFGGEEFVAPEYASAPASSASN